MRINNPKIAHQRVLELLDYDRVSGIFHWKKNRKGTLAGSVAGTRNKRGYILISIDNEHIYAHRLAMFYISGDWPKAHIDHIDRNPSNNSIVNLRLATPSQNLANRSKNKNKKTPKGVYRYRDRWKSCIKYDGLTRHIGCFNTVEEASAAYFIKAQSVFSEYARKD